MTKDNIAKTLCLQATAYFITLNSSEVCCWVSYSYHLGHCLLWEHFCPHGRSAFEFGVQLVLT